MFRNSYMLGDGSWELEVGRSIVKTCNLNTRLKNIYSKLKTIYSKLKTIYSKLQTQNSSLLL